MSHTTPAGVKPLDLTQILSIVPKVTKDESVCGEHLNATGMPAQAAAFPLNGKVKVALNGYKVGDSINYRFNKSGFKGKGSYEYYQKGTTHLLGSLPKDFMNRVTPDTTSAVSSSSSTSTVVGAANATRLYVLANQLYVSTPKLGFKKVGYKAEAVIDTTKSKIVSGATYYQIVKLKGNGTWESRVNVSGKLPAYWVKAGDYKLMPNQSSAPLNAAGYMGDGGDGQYDDNYDGSLDMQPPMDYSMQQPQMMPQQQYAPLPPQYPVQQQYAPLPPQYTDPTPVYQPQQQQPQYAPMQPQYPVQQPQYPSQYPAAQPQGTLAKSSQAVVTGQQVALKDANGELFNNGVNIQPYTLLIDTYFNVKGLDGTTTQVPMPNGSIIWSDAPFDYNNIAAEHKGSFPDPSDPDNQLQRYAWTSADFITPMGGLIPMRKDALAIVNNYQGPTVQAGGGTGVVAPTSKVTATTHSIFGAYADDTSKEAAAAHSSSKVMWYVGGAVVVAAAAFFAVKHFKPEWLGGKK